MSGWSANGNDGSSSSLFPVDDLVGDILHHVTETETSCKEYVGQERRCCGSIRDCYTPLNNTLATVRLNAITTQNIHQACKSIHSELNTLDTCVDTKADGCHWTVDETSIKNPFEANIESLFYEYGRHCGSLPPETTPPPVNTISTKRTTTKKSTPKSTTTSTTTPTTSTTPGRTPSTRKSKPPTTATITVSTATAKQPTTTTKPITTSTSSSSTSSTTTTTTTTTTTAITPTTSTDITHTSTDGDSETKEPTDATPVKPSRKPNGKPHVKPHEKTTHNEDRSDQSSTTESFTASTDTVIKPNTESTLKQSLPGNIDPVKSHPQNDDTIITVGAVLGGLLLMLIVAVVIIIKRRRNTQRQSDSDSSVTSEKRFAWKWFFQSSKPKPEKSNTDEEIYAEIDDAFMEAVYRVGTDHPPKVRGRIPSNTQVNVCYESGFDHEDDIIKSNQHGYLNNIHENQLQTNTNVGAQYENIFNQQDASVNSKQQAVSHGTKTNMHTSDTKVDKGDMITSFQSEKSRVAKQGKKQSKQTTPVLILSNQKAFVVSRPAFTDIRQTNVEPEAGEYVEIKDNPNGESEPMYDVPTDNDAIYNRTFHDTHKDKKKSTVVENNYDSLLFYANVSDKKSSKTKRPTKTEPKDVYVYEKEDTMMEY